MDMKRSEELHEKLNSLDKLDPTSLLKFSEHLIREFSELEKQTDFYREKIVWGFYEEKVPKFYQGVEGEHHMCEPVTAEFISNLLKCLDIYERERKRYLHANPDKFHGVFFLAGGLGEKDQNGLPQFVEIVPAYGVAWSQLYEKTDKQITMEGS
jgi:hypothetical protein